MVKAYLTLFWCSVQSYVSCLRFFSRVPIQHNFLKCPWFNSSFIYLFSNIHCIVLFEKFVEEKNIIVALDGTRQFPLGRKKNL